MKKRKVFILLVAVSMLFAGCGSNTQNIATENSAKETVDITAEEAGETEQEATNTGKTEQEATDTDSDIDTETGTEEQQTTETVAGEEADGMYAEYYVLIDKISNGIENGFSENEIDELGISPLFGLNMDFADFGYSMMDIDGNGIDELIIGENGSGAWGRVIYNIYTIADGQMVKVICGWDRNRYYLCDNGLIANEGSNGASSSIYRFYSYSGTELELQEAVIYDGYKDAENPWFYSTESEDVNQASNITGDEAGEIIGSYNYEKIDFTSFISASGN